MSPTSFTGFQEAPDDETRASREAESVDPLGVVVVVVMVVIYNNIPGTRYTSRLDSAPDKDLMNGKRQQEGGESRLIGNRYLCHTLLRSG